MWIAGFGACSSDPPDALQTGFAFMNKEKLDYDCRQVLSCNDMMMNDAVGTYDDCINGNAKTLNENAAGQATFLTKYFRCHLHENCDYTRCVTMDPVTSYGMSQINLLNYICGAKAQCGSEMGNPVSGDMNVAINNCAAMYVGSLDTWQLDQRNAFVDKFNSCGTLGSCQFVACFPY